MNWLDYFLKTNLYLVLFYGCYWLGLRKHTFFGLNRAYLLLSIGLALVLPFVDLSAQTIEAIPVTVMQLPITITNQPAAAGPDWIAIGWQMYGLVALLLLGRFLFRIAHLLRFIQRSTRQKADGYTLVLPQSASTPTFSFFHFLVLSPADAAGNWELIRQHERVHIQQRHSLDVLFLELAHVVFWANPVLFLYKQAIQQIHEFLADQLTTTDGTTDKQQYMSFLVDYTFGIQPPSFSTPFSQPSNLKQRIVMLQKSKTNRWALGKYLVIGTVASALTVYVTACEERAKQEVKAVSEAGTTPEVMVKNGKQIFTTVEEQPEFPGGMAALGKFIGENIHYPEQAAKNKVEGRVFVRFLVNTDGSIQDVQLLKGIGYGADAEAIRVVQAMPKWTPGKQKGQPVNVQYNLPINFQLEEKQPLYLVDGKEVPKASLDKIDPKAIQSVNVLDSKHAAAYGEKGKNGVILVTTKK